MAFGGKMAIGGQEVFAAKRTTIAFGEIPTPCMIARQTRDATPDGCARWEKSVDVVCPLSVVALFETLGIALDVNGVDGTFSTAQRLLRAS